MEKSIKLFWRYFGSLLVFAEVAVYIFLVRSPFPWQFIRLTFMAINLIIIAHLVKVKLQVEKHNAEVNATMTAGKISYQVNGLES
jgi:hypothetical protein